MKDYGRELFSDPEKYKEYTKAIDTLQNLNILPIMYQLEGNKPIFGEANTGTQQAALEYAFLSGWRGCLNTLFSLHDIFSVEESSEIPVDFGAKNMLRKLGYKEKDLETLIKE